MISLALPFFEGRPSQNRAQGHNDTLSTLKIFQLQENGQEKRRQHL